MKCDVLVVGASPAGITAAVTASKAGSIVVLLDRDLESFDHPANTLFEGMASRAGLEIDGCYIQRTLQGMRIISPGDYAVTIPAKGYFLDRNKFDEHYLDAAERNGTIMMKEEVVRTYLHSGRRTVVTTDEEIDAGVVIDASGVRSVIGRQAGLSTMRHPNDIAWAMEATVEHPGIGEEEFFEYWVGSVAPGWKATYSPAGGDRATLGVFVRGHGQNVQPIFRSFLKRFKRYKYPSYRDIDDMKILWVKRGGDPIAVLPGEIVSDALMITGGAAGQSGLAYSMRAGALCGTVAADAANSKDFSREWLMKYQRAWNWEFLMEYRTARACLETIRGMSDEELDNLTKGLAGKDIVPDGPFYRKLVQAGLITAVVKPGSIAALVKNMVLG